LKNRVDKVRILAVVLVLLLGTKTIAEELPQIKNINYFRWTQWSDETKMAWVVGVMSGVHYLVVVYGMEQKDSRILQYLPNHWNSYQLVDLIDLVYLFDTLKATPTVDIIMRANHWLDVMDKAGAFDEARKREERGGQI